MVDAAETKLLDSVPDGLFIGGDWAPATSGATLKVYDPATGEVIKAIADGGVADGAAAMDAAVDAAADWAKTPPRERAELLRRAFDLIRERKDEVALLMTLEMGKPFAESRAEAVYGGEFLRWFSE
jgi:succinate-semialdehyde dehydrogenase/glutarate-semialdehyde dehydrogenase